MKKTIMIILLTFIVMLASCQPNPDKQIVVNKGEDTFYNALDQENPNSIDITDIPEHVNSRYKAFGEKFKLVIDADVSIKNNINKFPVLKIKPHYISVDQANVVVEKIFGDTDVYCNHVQMSKTQLEEFIIDVKAEQQRAINDGDDIHAEALQETIDSLLLELENAPEEVSANLFDGSFHVYDEGGYEEIALRVDPFDKTSPILEIRNVKDLPYSNGYDSEVLYEDINRRIFSCTDANLESEEAKAALEKVESFVKMIDENVTIEKVYAFTSKEGTNEPTGYKMFCVRNFNGITMPLYVQKGGTMAQSDEDDYIKPYISESMIVEIEGDEIKYFEWRNIIDIDTTLNENIELMQFEEIIDNVENQLAVKYAFLEGQSGKMSLYVDKIILTYAIEPIKDQKYEYMLVPVWAFYGGFDFGNGCKLADGTVMEGKHEELGSLLTINAVDGTIIFGY